MARRRPKSVDAIHAWWRANQEAGRASLLFAHPLGKAQRLLALLDPAIGPIYTHGAVEGFNRIYRDQGIALAPTIHVEGSGPWTRALVVAPPSAHGSPWERRFGSASTAFASGWMRIRGTRRRRSLDRGFVFSDHADWSGLLRAIEATGADIRLGHPRLSRPDGALALRARPSRPSLSKPVSRRPSLESLRRTVRRPRRNHQDQRQDRGAQTLSRRPRSRKMPPGPSTS